MNGLEKIGAGSAAEHVRVYTYIHEAPTSIMAENYEVDEHGYPTALGCYQIMRAIIEMSPRPEYGSAEYTNYCNAMYALGYIKSALNVVEE